MAVLSVQSVVRTGLDPAFVAADVAGDSFANADGLSFLHVKNGDASPHTVTFTSTARVSPGLDRKDEPVTVPAGGERVCGPWPVNSFNNATTNQVDVTYDAVTSVTVAALRFDASS